MTRTLDDFWPAVEAAAPDDPQPLLVCADWCQENGEAKLGYALKWCAGRRRRPYRRGDVVRFPWVWMRDQTRYAHISAKEAGRRAACILPRQVFEFGEADTCEDAWKSSRAAYQALADWLDEARVAVEVPQIVVPPQPEVVRLGPVACDRCGLMRAPQFLDCPLCAGR